MYTTRFLFYAGLARLGLAAYSIQDNYDSGNWVDMFDFNTFDDPTHGYVNYVDRATAQYSGLFKTDSNVVTFGSDSTSVASGRGRNSVRLTSKNQYTHGLVVVDIAHMPGNACGVWPAFWMTGPNWPNSGEIDIIEGVNLQSGNTATLHTNGGCSFDGTSCLGNLGCSKPAGGSNSYGDGFNANNGGVYALEWTASRLNVWFFGRGSEPEDVLGDAPDPSQWGTPTTTFTGGNGCDIDTHFQNQNIVFDTTFCGDWAGSVFSQDSTCATKGSSCADYVKNNPKAFSEAYWTVNALKVYSDNGSGPRILTSGDITPTSSTSAIFASPPIIATNSSEPAPLASATTFFSNSLEPLPSPIPSVRAITTINPPISSQPEIETETPASSLPAATATAAATPSTSPTTNEVVTSAETAPTSSAVVDYYTAPAPAAGYEYRHGQHGSQRGSVPGSSPEKKMKMKRAHRAARHLKHHRAGL